MEVPIGFHLFFFIKIYISKDPFYNLLAVEVAIGNANGTDLGLEWLRMLRSISFGAPECIDFYFIFYF